MYKLVGSWGFSPSAKHWKNFSEWGRKFRRSGEKPYVEGLRPTEWYKRFEKEGRCPGVKCMWTMHHIKYISQYPAYTVYLKAPHSMTLASNFREPGLHYAKPSSGPDHKLVKDWSPFIASFPEEPLKLGWNGKLT